MEFITDIVGGFGMALAGVASGGILSIVTAGIKGIGAWAKRKQEHQMKMDEWKREERLEKLKQDGRNQDSENELKIAQSEGSWKGLGSSYQTIVKASEVHKWVNDVRSLFRLVLTIFLFSMVWYFFAQLMDVMRGSEAALIAAFTPDQAGELIRYMVVSIVFTACTAGTWWFGDRALTPNREKSR